MDVTITNISKRYAGGKHALRNVSLDLHKGMFGLLGPNGAGKTTLMRIMATLLPPIEGDIWVGDFSIRRHPTEIRHLLGYLPQQFNTYPQLTVAEFLDYFALLSGLRRKRQMRIDTLLEQVNLTEQRKQRTGTLSGGMKRRLGIAQALLNDPQLLIVDEPTAGLDPAERVRFRNLLATLSGDRIVILSTHIVEDIASTCNDLAILNQGQVLLRGTPKDLISIAQHKVWVIDTTQSEFEQLQSSYHILSTVRNDNGWRIRMLADALPTPHATADIPTIEDGYMYLMQGGARG
jgi:ABC-type multidrug transport system ATPase subunit